MWRPDFRTSVTAENMCLCDMQQYSLQDAQIDALIARFLNPQRQRITRTYNTYAIATTQYYQSNTNNLVKTINDSDLLIHQKAYSLKLYFTCNLYLP